MKDPMPSWPKTLFLVFLFIALGLVSMHEISKALVAYGLALICLLWSGGKAEG